MFRAATPLPRHAVPLLALIWGAATVASGMFAAQWGLSALAPEPGARLLLRRAVPPVVADRPHAPAIAAPGSGMTGTVALPPVAPAGPALPAETVAARPFVLAGIGASDRARALECLTAAIYYEAASESDDGQRAVAQVVLNRVRHLAFPASVCGVVYQGSDHAGCQFSFACDGAMARAPSSRGWARAARNAAAALHGLVYAPVGLATHYHTYAVTPAWNRTLVMTDAVGAHFFHRWKGLWGTPAAFVQRYRGGEPLPGPRAAMPDAAAAVVVSTTPAIMPAVAPTPLPATPALPESTILDRWKDSGKPLK